MQPERKLSREEAQKLFKRLRSEAENSAPSLAERLEERIGIKNSKYYWRKRGKNENHIKNFLCVSIVDKYCRLWFFSKDET